MNLLETGKITKTHGILGEVSIDPWCDSPQNITEYKVLFLKNGKKLSLESARLHKSAVLAKFTGVNSIEDAMGIVNEIIYIDKDKLKLEEGQYLIADLLGVEVSHVETGEVYGKITFVQSTGANDVYHVTRDDKKLFLVPAIKSVVKEIDIESKTMKIVPLDGLFD